MLLLDTCALLWLAGDQAELSVRAREAIVSCAEGLTVSAMSAWEIGIAVAKKRIEMERTPEEWFAAAVKHHHIAVTDVDWRIAVASTRLPAIHGDPCDRIVIATALRLGVPVVTADQIIPAYPGVEVVW